MSKSRKFITAIVAVAVVSGSVFHACKKEDTIPDSNLTQNSKEHKSFDEALLNSILNQVGFDFASYVEGDNVENEYTVTYGGQSYGVFITNAASKLDAWLAIEAADGKETGSFVKDGLLVGISSEHKCNHFVHMTDAERTYLIANGESMTIDDFKLHAIEIITSKVGQILVTTMKDGNVYFMGISATGNQALWYNRLHEHFINHPPIIVNPDDPLPVGCIISDGSEEDEKMFDEWIAKALEIDLDIIITYVLDDDGVWWKKACNGTCFC